MTPHRATLLLLCCTACWSKTYRTECSEPVYTELADDEASPIGVTANSVLAIATPGWEGFADRNGSEVDAAFTVERGVGPALFADTEEYEVVTRSFDPGGGSSAPLTQSVLSSDVSCDDWVEVPAAFAIVSEEADIDLEMDATIRSPTSRSQWDSGADIEGNLPYEQSGLVIDGIDETTDDQTIELFVSMQPAEQSTGSLSWHGSEQDEERSVRILAWDNDSY